MMAEYIPLKQLACIRITGFAVLFTLVIRLVEAIILDMLPLEDISLQMQGV
jgi:hypothetical protein